MTEVYIVRYGEYSDQGIAGVFSTKEKAEYYCSIRNQIDIYEHYWVDERVLDEQEYEPNAKVCNYYMVEIAIKDIPLWSNPSEIEYHKGEFIINAEDGVEEKMVFSNPNEIVKSIDGNSIIVYSSESVDKAEKIAIEQYQIYTQQKLENGEL